MYAVIQTGGKQYRVAPGDTVRVERSKQKSALLLSSAVCWQPLTPPGICSQGRI